VVIIDLIQSHKRKNNDSITNSVYLGIGCPTRVVSSMVNDNELKLVKQILSDIDCTWKFICLFVNEKDKKRSQTECIPNDEQILTKI